MTKKIHVHRILCTGCMECELVCSINKTEYANPHHSRIKVTKIPEKGIFYPVVCRQCEPAPCIEQCPSSALSRDLHANAIVVDVDLCTDCRMCIETCPFGAIQHSDHEGIFVCDLCGGDPLCVKYCRERPANSSAFMSNPNDSALQFTESSDFASTKRLMNLLKQEDDAV